MPFNYKSKPVSALTELNRMQNHLRKREQKKLHSSTADTESPPQAHQDTTPTGSKKDGQHIFNYRGSFFLHPITAFITISIFLLKFYELRIILLHSFQDSGLSTRQVQGFALKTESGFYYSFYEDFVRADSLWGAIVGVLYDTRSEYPHEINALSRFNIWQEIVVGLNARFWISIKSIVFLSEVDFATETWTIYITTLCICGGILYASIAGIVLELTSTKNIMMNNKTNINTSSLRLSITPSISGVIGVVLTILGCYVNQGQISRALNTTSMNLRENWSLPFLALQVWMLIRLMWQLPVYETMMKVTITNQNTELKVSQFIFVISLFLTVLFWQFSPFILVLQGAALFLVYLLSIFSSSISAAITRNTFARIIDLSIIGYGSALILLGGNELMLASPYSLFLVSVRCILYVGKFTRSKDRNKVVKSLILLLEGSASLMIFGFLKYLISLFTSDSADGHILEILCARVEPKATETGVYSTIYRSFCPEERTFNARLYLVMGVFHAIDESTVNVFKATGALWMSLFTIFGVLGWNCVNLVGGGIFRGSQDRLDNDKRTHKESKVVNVRGRKIEVPAESGILSSEESTETKVLRDLKGTTLSIWNFFIIQFILWALLGSFISRLRALFGVYMCTLAGLSATTLIFLSENTELYRYSDDADNTVTNLNSESDRSMISALRTREKGLKTMLIAYIKLKRISVLLLTSFLSYTYGNVVISLLPCGPSGTSLDNLPTSTICGRAGPNEHSDGYDLLELASFINRELGPNNSKEKASPESDSSPNTVVAAAMSVSGALRTFTTPSTSFVIHPHYEHADLRRRTQHLYAGLFHCMSPYDFSQRVLEPLQANYVVIELSRCFVTPFDIDKGLREMLEVGIPNAEKKSGINCKGNGKDGFSTDDLMCRCIFRYPDLFKLRFANSAYALFERKVIYKRETSENLDIQAGKMLDAVIDGQMGYSAEEAEEVKKKLESKKIETTSEKVSSSSEIKRIQNTYPALATALLQEDTDLAEVLREKNSPKQTVHSTEFWSQILENIIIHKIKISSSNKVSQDLVGSLAEFGLGYFKSSSNRNDNASQKIGMTIFNALEQLVAKENFKNIIDSQSRAVLSYYKGRLLDYDFGNTNAARTKYAESFDLSINSNTYMNPSFAHEWLLFLDMVAKDPAAVMEASRQIVSTENIDWLSQKTNKLSTSIVRTLLELSASLALHGGSNEMFSINEISSGLREIMKRSNLQRDRKNQEGGLSNHDKQISALKLARILFEYVAYEYPTHKLLPATVQHLNGSGGTTAYKPAKHLKQYKQFTELSDAAAKFSSNHKPDKTTSLLSTVDDINQDSQSSDWIKLKQVISGRSLTHVHPLRGVNVRGEIIETDDDLY